MCSSWILLMWNFNSIHVGTTHIAILFIILVHCVYFVLYIRYVFTMLCTYLEMVHSESMALQIFCAASLLKIKWAISLHQVSTPIWQPSLSGICWQTYRIIQYSIESREVGSSNHLNNILIPYRQNSHPSGSLRKEEVEEKNASKRWQFVHFRIF